MFYPKLSIGNSAFRQTLFCCLIGILFSHAVAAQQSFTWEQIRSQFEKTNPTLLYRDTQLNYVNLIGSYLTAASQLNLAVGREVIQ